MVAWQYIRRLLDQLPGACAANLNIVAFAAEVRALYAAARRAMHRDLRVTRYTAPCPSCGERALRKGVGEEEITCRGCGCVWDDDEYAVAAVQALPDDALLYAHEVAVLVKVKPSTVDVWCWRGRLAPDAWDGKAQSEYPDDRGRPLYSAGQARQVAHEVMLYREAKAELIVYWIDDDEPESQIFAAGTTLDIAGVMEVTLPRGAIATVGPLAWEHGAIVTEQEATR